jgi:hypothetical protein
MTIPSPEAKAKFRELTYVGYSIGRRVDTDGDGRYDELHAETRLIRNPRTYDQPGIPFADDGETNHQGAILFKSDRQGPHAP